MNSSSSPVVVMVNSKGFVYHAFDKAEINKSGFVFHLQNSSKKKIFFRQILIELFFLSTLNSKIMIYKQIFHIK